MKPPLRILFLALLLFMPFSTAQAQGPSLSPIANVTINVGGTLNINLVSVDAANRPVSLTAALPPFATLNAPTLGTGIVVTSLTLAPTNGQVGDYSAAVTATAGGVSTVRVFQITVNAAGSDQAPIVTVSPLQEVTAGSTLNFTVTAGDPDGNAISSLSVSDLPFGASFTPNGSNTSASFMWTPGASDAGEYDLQFTAMNTLAGSSVTHIRVAAAPTLAITPIPDVTVAGGSFLSVPVHASGVPGELITLTASLPGFATLDPPGSGTGSVSTSVSISPPTGSAGTYHASITASSAGVNVTEPFDIIVTGSVGGTNRPPVVSAPASETVAIGSTLTFEVTASDPDTDHVDLFGSALPPGSGFIDHANNTGTFSWTPVAGQGGTYTASFSGTDGNGGSGSASTIITVTGDVPVNHPPTVSAPATEHVNVGDHLSFTVTASDPDGDHVTLSTSSLPAGATFGDNGDNTGTFSWTPGIAQTGNFGVAFLGFDGRGGTGTASTSIAVANPGGGGGGGGGGGEVPGHACLIDKFKPHRANTCFRISPVDNSFVIQDVILSSIRLQFHGQTIPALSGASIDVCCRHDGHDGDDHDGDDDGDDHDGDDDGDGRHGGDHHGDLAGDRGPATDYGLDKGDDDDCDLRCDDRCHHGHDHHGDRDHGHHDTCDTLGIRACFSTSALIRLVTSSTANASSTSHGRNRLPCSLLDAQILATLANGDTIVATFTSRDGHHHGDGDDDGDDDDVVAGHGSQQDALLSARATPNPLHPNTMLSFEMKQDGRVRVAVYDMQGRVVKKLADEFRVAGLQALVWDGTNDSNARVPNGVYFFRIQVPEGSVTRRVAVVK